jgi:ubiquinone/menaquinone biosynthesis C-methylase UbiE
LQRALLERNLRVFGLDESTQMGRLARHNLRRYIAKSAHPDYAQIKLTRGISQHLPFPSESFDSIVSTFPSEYIFDPKTLGEAQRVLAENGRFIILPGASILGRGILDRAMAFLFRITGETPPDLVDILHERTRKPFTSSGFQVEIHELNIKSSMVFIVVATKVAR